MKMQLIVSAMLFLWGMGCVSAAEPSLNEIVGRVLDRDEALQKALSAYEYDQKVSVQKLDGSGKAVKTRTVQMVVRPGKKNSFTIVADKKGDGAFIPGEVSYRDRKIAEDSEKSKETFALRDLAQRYQLKLAGTAKLDTHETWVIHFTPKPNQSFKNRTEKVLNSLEGDMWVNQADYSILRTEAKLKERVELAWFFVTLDKMTFSYRAQPIPIGFGPALLKMDLNVSVPFFDIRQRQIISMENFRGRK